LKKGDKVPVLIAGDVATQAVVESVDMETRRATLVIPATRVVMALRVEIDTAPQVVEETDSKQTVITGVDRVDSEGNIIEGASTGEPVAASESAPVGENPQNDNSGAVETPQPDSTQTQVSASQQPEQRAVVRETEPVVSVEQTNG
jgi:hypothetical protein